MEALIAFIILDLIVVVGVMYYGTREDNHNVSSSAPSVVTMKTAAEKTKERVQRLLSVYQQAKTQAEEEAAAAKAKKKPARRGAKK